MNYILHLENGLLEIIGVTKVVSATNGQAVVQTEDSRIIINGNEMEVKCLDLEQGKVCLVGKFTDLKLNSSAKKQPFLKRIFK